MPGPATRECCCCDGLIGDSAPRFSSPSLFCFLSISPETHFVFILKTQQTTPLLDSAAASGCHPVSLLPGSCFLGECLPTYSQPLSSAFHTPHSGRMLQPRAPHDFLFSKAKPVFWLLDLSQTGHRLPLTLPSAFSSPQHLTLLITPSRIKLALVLVLPGLS